MREVTYDLTKENTDKFYRNWYKYIWDKKMCNIVITHEQHMNIIVHREETNFDLECYNRGIKVIIEGKEENK